MSLCLFTEQQYLSETGQRFYANIYIVINRNFNAKLHCFKVEGRIRSKFSYRLDVLAVKALRNYTNWGNRLLRSVPFSYQVTIIIDFFFNWYLNVYSNSPLTDCMQHSLWFTLIHMSVKHYFVFVFLLKIAIAFRSNSTIPKRLIRDA